MPCLLQYDKQAKHRYASSAIISQENPEPPTDQGVGFAANVLLERPRARARPWGKKFSFTKRHGDLRIVEFPP